MHTNKLNYFIFSSDTYLISFQFPSTSFQFPSNTTAVKVMAIIKGLMLNSPLLRQTDATIHHATGYQVNATLLLWTTRSTTINYATENAVLSLCSMNIAKNHWVTLKGNVVRLRFHYIMTDMFCTSWEWNKFRKPYKKCDVAFSPITKWIFFNFNPFWHTLNLHWWN